jgi:hypothetical protein
MANLMGVPNHMVVLNRTAVLSLTEELSLMALSCWECHKVTPILLRARPGLRLLLKFRCKDKTQSPRRTARLPTIQGSTRQ